MIDTGLNARDLETIEKILADVSEIKTVYIFGSRAKGTFKHGSDIDLVIMHDDLSDNQIMQLKSAFDESDLPYVVDIVQYSSIKHEGLKEHIDRVGKLFYERGAAQN